MCLCFRVEKYRPQTLDDLISHKDILSTSEYMWSKQIYNPRFYSLRTLGFRHSTKSVFDSCFLFCLQSRSLSVRTSFLISCSTVPLEQAKPPPSSPVPNSCTRTKSSTPWCWRYTTTPQLQELCLFKCEDVVALWFDIYDKLSFVS